MDEFYCGFCGRHLNTRFMVRSGSGRPRCVMCEAAKINAALNLPGRNGIKPMAANKYAANKNKKSYKTGRSDKFFSSL